MKEEPQKSVIGIDEVGLGPICGPVVVAAVVFPRWQDLSKSPIPGVRDSKKLSENRRAVMDKEIRKHARHWVIAQSNPKTIDKYGIAECKRACMRACAVRCLALYPKAQVIIDGDDPIHGLPNIRMMVKADDKVAAVGAASIIAKVYRDKYMVKLSYRYPKYGFEKHKGYPTKEHKDALERFGVCPQHRRSYNPIKRLLANEGHGNRRARR